MVKGEKKSPAAMKRPRRQPRLRAAQSLPVLDKNEAPPFLTVNPKVDSPVLIVCDHASNTIPRRLKNLGLSARDRKKHIAWDPGTEDIGRYLSRKIKAPLLLAQYSRLVCDLNRGARHSHCMRAMSDAVVIPGNQDLSAEDKKARLDALYWPYHAEITRRLDAVLARGQVPLLLSIHSFTPQMVNAPPRPWHIGIMWNQQEKLSKALVANLRRDNPALTIGENQPYSLKGAAAGKNTIQRHGEDRDLPYLAIEFRQDLVGGSKKEAEDWAALLLRSLAPLLEDKKNYKKRG